MRGLPAEAALAKAGMRPQSRVCQDFLNDVEYLIVVRHAF